MEEKSFGDNDLDDVLAIGDEADEDVAPEIGEEGDFNVPRLVSGKWKIVRDIQGQYLREMRRYKYLTIEEERDLFRRYQENNDRDAWEKLILCNQPMVIKQAKYHARKHHLPLLDMIQEGNFGLMRAIAKFSLEKECKLITYATQWIDQSITRAIMNTSGMIRLPVHVSELLSKSHKAVCRLWEELGREPTKEELAKDLSISVKRLNIVEEGLKKILSTDVALSSMEDGDLLGDFIPDDKPLQDEVVYEKQLSGNVIRPALATLKPRKRFVIMMRFGLDGIIFSEPDIAEVMKIGLDEVRDLELSMLQKINLPEHLMYDRQGGMDWLGRVSRKTLTMKEELVFMLRYGIGAEESAFESVGRWIGLTRQRIEQIERETLPLLRHYMDKEASEKEKKNGIYVKSKKVAISAAAAMRGVL